MKAMLQAAQEVGPSVHAFVRLSIMLFRQTSLMGVKRVKLGLVGSSGFKLGQQRTSRVKLESGRVRVR